VRKFFRAWEGCAKGVGNFSQDLEARDNSIKTRATTMKQKEIWME
jgi:hypothetical protein